MLKIYNSLSRAKEPFVPLDPPRVKMYVCGMTVYDYCHLGHARVMIVFDLVQRWLRASGYQLTYVRNITDIDDKIIRRAVENGETIGALTERFIRYMDEDAAALGVRKPDLEPRATQHIADMLAMIAKLEERGMAYRAGSGDVNFSVRKFPGYGKLSGKSIEDLRAGERVDVDATKHDPLDFVLWKHAKEGEPFWQSPWGNGRPGWHIECSAMATRLLGAHFDIHGGGQDLQFPHHENEIAQSEGALNENEGKRFVNYWMHNGFVRVDEEKMSKSLGNFFTIRDLLRRYDAEVLRFFVARAHYRSPLNYSDQHLEDARQALTRLYTALKGAPTETGTPDWNEPHARRFREAMDDDFNTPEAMAILFELANEINRTHSRILARQVRALGGILGLLQRDSVEFLQGRHDIEVHVTGVAARAESGTATVNIFPPDEVERLIQQRVMAKEAKNFREADRIRAELLAAGIVLEDGRDGTTWRRQ
ncbi:MAG: cysteine--tRNA ligase [Burkholderiales bacterium]